METSRHSPQAGRCQQLNRLLLSAALLGAAGCVSRPPDNLQAYQPHAAAMPVSRNTIQPGETLEVYVVQDPSFNGNYEVREGGHIIFPRLGKISVTGASCEQVEKKLKALLEGNQLHAATVMVERSATHNAPAPRINIYLTGNVVRKGRIGVPIIAGQSPTVFQAILEAGGFSRFADQKHVLIVHRSGGATTRRTVDVRLIRDGSRADVALEEGDMIFVPEKTFGW